MNPGFGGTLHEFQWSWKGKPVTITYEVLGEGKPILLLPALSTVSSRSEMSGLATQLAQQFQVIAIDWVGFGQSTRLPIHYQPAVYHACLRSFVQAQFSEPVVAIGAGHAASYVMNLAQQQPCPWSYVILIAPTWRGPLPTVMGERRRLYEVLRRIVELPLIGQLLYFLNTVPPFLKFMYRRHVFANPKNITSDMMRQKWRTTQQRNARFASVAFVTGGLDVVHDRREFLDYFQPLPVPTLLVIGEHTPPKSREEMEIVGHFSGVQVYRMPGSLGLHEEYPYLLLNGILPFLQKYLS